MKIEISSGGVIYRLNNSTFEVLLLKDKNGFWSFPKGLIEDGEDKLTAAKREIGEEVGIHGLKMVTELAPINYIYKWKESIIKKTVYFFLFKYIGGETPKPQLEEGITETKWFDLDESIQIVGYPKTNKAVLEETLASLRGTNVASDAAISPVTYAEIAR